MTAAPAAISSDVLLARILASLDDDKAEDVVTIDLRGRSSVADHMVICSGRSSRQVAAIAQHLAERIKKATGRSARVEGLPVADWVLIDAGDVIVHIFRPEVREFYNLERMWAFDSEPNKGEPRMGVLREGRDPALGDPRKLG